VTNWPLLAVTAIGMWGYTPVRITGVLVLPFLLQDTLLMMQDHSAYVVSFFP